MAQLKTQNSKLKIGVIILGAGASSRMGRPKLLLPWGKTTIVGHLIEQWRALGAAQIAVVGRPDDPALVEALKREALKRNGAGTLLRFNASTHYIVNPQPERGMFSSILCATNWDGWKNGLTDWVIVLGDQPHLRPGTLRALLAFHREHPGAICQPLYSSHTRHPVVMPLRAFEELKHSRVKNLKEFLKRTSCPLVKCPIEDSGLALDLDRPEDYEKVFSPNAYE